jgi:hypothetical protein
LRDHTRLFSHLTAINTITSDQVTNVIGKNQMVIVEDLAEGGSKLGVKLVTLFPPDRIECELYTDLFDSRAFRPSFAAVIARYKPALFILLRLWLAHGFRAFRDRRAPSLGGLAKRGQCYYCSHPFHQGQRPWPSTCALYHVQGVGEEAGLHRGNSSWARTALFIKCKASTRAVRPGLRIV